MLGLNKLVKIIHNLYYNWVRKFKKTWQSIKTDKAVVKKSEF